MTMIAFVILLTLVAAITDWRTGKIPNWLTLSGLIVSFAWQGIDRGMTGALVAGLGVIACALVPWLLYRATKGQAIGGGDIKLLAAIGAALGPQHGLEVELTAFSVLALLALVQLAYRGALFKVLFNAGVLLIGPLLPRTWRPRIEPEALSTMRMGPAFAIAACVFALSQSGWSVLS